MLKRHSEFVPVPTAGTFGIGFDPDADYWECEHSYFRGNDCPACDVPAGMEIPVEDFVEVS
jgi:hypothetical protein